MHNILYKTWKRNTLNIFFFFLILILGFSVGKAFASNPETKVKATYNRSVEIERVRLGVAASLKNEPIVKEIKTATENRAPASAPVASIPSVPLPPGSHADWLRQAGVPEDQLGNAEWLVNHENGLWCPTRGYGQTHCPETPGPTGQAYGIPQALPGTKMASAGADWATNPITQLRWMHDYVTSRYNGWQQAKDAWISRSRSCPKPDNPTERCGGWY